MSSVTLLPQELTRAQEGLRMFEFPPDDRVPLVKTEGKVTMRTDPLRIVGVHDCLGGGTNGDVLLKLVLTTGKR
jgi:hypothetical protein